MAAFRHVVWFKRHILFFNRRLLERTQPHCRPYSDLRKEPPSNLPDISIPLYIPRGPTDILRAIASTIQPDPTAAHYTFHDDPGLIPQNTVSLRNFALSKDSGRRAARYFLEKYPSEFETDDSQPKIPDFYATIRISEDSPVTEESLLDFVKTLQVENALQAYVNLKSGNVAISHETKSDLLELLSFYNSKEPSDTRYLDQRYFEPDTDGRKASEQKTTWIDNGPAEKLFDEMEVKDARSYHAIILGMCKYLESNKAEQLFAEMKEKGFPANTKIYNGLISLDTFTWDEVSTKWVKIMNYLKCMSEENLKPDLETFHNLLFMLSRNRNRDVTERALSVMAEMKAAGVQPSLGIFHLLLSIFCTSRGPTCYILHDILDLIEHKKWTLQHPNDFSFFTSAMAVCAVHLRDPQIAHRLHAMLCRNNNTNFLETRLREKSYYTHYLRLLLEAEDLDEFFKAYDQLVPSIYMPEPNLMEQLITAVNVQGEIRFLPRLWTDVVRYQLAHRPAIVSEALSLVATVGPQTDADVQRQLLDIAWNVWDNLYKRKIERPNLQFQFCWTADMLENLLKILICGNEMEQAWRIVSTLIIPNQDVAERDGLGKALMLFCEAALEGDYREKALKVIRHATLETMPEVMAFLTKHKDKMPEEFFENYKVVPTSEENKELSNASTG